MAIEPLAADAQSRNKVKETDFSSRPSSITDEAGEKQQQGEPPSTDSTDSPAPEGPQEGDGLEDHLEGFRLFALLISIGLIFFLLLLDTSIISTVSD
jgi:hypothetical protein